MSKLIFKPIGRILSSYKEPKNVPIQSSFANGSFGKIEVFNEFLDGLKDVDQFSHLIIIYQFHQNKNFKLIVKPFLDTKEHGVFATRAPKRPNNIGISIVKLIKIENNILHIDNCDIIDQTPLLDIKPYIPDFDIRTEATEGWYKGKKENHSLKADNRFIN